ncbi:UNVERIFIED_CONTAM: 4-carboxy-4-hydroxy-2-oxoadipate aldolase/oxaloacetate decarboxylase [Microbacterium sp. SLM126]
MTQRLNNLGIVRTRIERPDPADVARLSQFGVATIHEAMGRVGLLRPYIHPAYTGAKLCGPAVTVLLQPGDNWMFHVAAEQVRDGDVIVAGCTTESEDGFFGELLATSLTARGCKGLVIDGGVRDVADLEKMDFPVFSRAINAKGTVKATLGSVNIPVVVANAVVNPGDVVVADVDGVVVVPRELVGAVAEASALREANEESKRQKFRDGVLGLDLYGMRDPLAAAGFEYVED